jgi:hypothetical protein
MPLQLHIAGGEAVLSELCEELNIAGQCSMCGRVRNLFVLPGRPEKFCLECSADVASAIQLTTEIDAEASAGRATAALESEFSEVSRRILERSQLADLSDV